jgi:uncharacterized membrane protein
VGFFSIFRKRFFSREEEKKIVAAIRSAEAGTSGEVRIHFSEKIVTDVLSDASMAFTRLEMQKTSRRNGVLIYVVPGAKQFAIIGDEGFHMISGNDFWQTVKDKMQNFFREGNFTEGIIIGLEEVGHILKQHFPREDNDTNELKDEISYGE